ncbi:MAG: NRDE family protein [Planctomycetes bacterium]|nr:NRDE family protein [Planctomycetota bacterium]
MCLLAIMNRVVADAPLVVGANREESYARGGEPPRILDGPTRILCGTDPQAGGTWFGVNQHGVLAAITNRLKSALPTQPRSRGMLVRDLLACASAADALNLACRELSSNRYAGCNVVIADIHRVEVVQAGDWLRVRPLTPGIHVVTNHDVNSASDPRTRHAIDWLERHSFRTADECLLALAELCGRTEPPPICLRGDDRGTVSSTLLALAPTLLRGRFLHAQGPPDRTPFADLSHLLRQLAPGKPLPIDH